MDETYEVSLKASAKEMQEIANDLRSNQWVVDLSEPPNIEYRYKGDNWKGAASELSRCLHQDHRVVSVFSDRTNRTMHATVRRLKAAMLLDGDFAEVRQRVKDMLE